MTLNFSRSHLETSSGVANVLPTLSSKAAGTIQRMCDHDRRYTIVLGGRPEKILQHLMSVLDHELGSEFKSK